MERFAPPILIEVGQTCFMRRSGMFKMVKEKSEFIHRNYHPQFLEIGFIKDGGPAITATMR
ncbi:MAG: hypothetical protein AOA65_2044 [Candidatus Bathyarchaeota archaeon BA1]|nr:MAG: hypothetical protein AOA65_2044 [Candidatus Bathyarchaeota archaeon BA1]